MKFVIGPQDRSKLGPHGGVAHTECLLCSEDPRFCY